MIIKRFLPIVVILNLVYLIWVFPHLNGWVGAIFYIAELVLISLTIVLGICHWERTDIIDQRFKPEGSVDVFITCYNEPLSMIWKTVRAACAMSYKNKKIYLLDDGPRKEVKGIARHYGINYLSRGTNKDAKAGNLNYGLEHSNSEFILTLDADQVPERRLLNKTLGHFQEGEDIAMVTTRQSFDVHGRDFNHDYLFYHYMQPGKTTEYCPTSCGSGVIYRRSSLEKIEGFQTWNMVEDLYTSYTLNQRGYRSVYINKAYTMGLAPQDIKNIYKQRGTWALDSLRIFFRKNPFFVKGLTWRQRVHYLEITYHYLVSGFFLPILFLFPVISLFTNYPIIFTSEYYLPIRMPGLIAIILFYGQLNRGHESNQFWAGLWPVYLKSTFLALMPGKTKYKVTQKVEAHGRRIFLVLPQLIVLTAGVIGIPFSILFFGISPNTYINATWILLQFWWVSPIIAKGFTKKHRYTPRLHEDVGEIHV